MEDYTFQIFTLGTIEQLWNEISESISPATEIQCWKCIIYGGQSDSSVSNIQCFLTNHIQVERRKRKIEGNPEYIRESVLRRFESHCFTLKLDREVSVQSCVLCFCQCYI